MTENWVRVIEENGFYVTTKITNVEKFLKETGTPAEMIDTIGDYKMCWKACGDNIKMVEWFGETEVTFTSKLDEESDYVWPVAGVPASKYCITRTGNGKYTSMVKDEAGNESEWTFQFCGEGAKIVSFIENITQKVAFDFSILAVSTNFCLIKSDLSGNTV